jgi:hypothetical protein
LCFDVALVGTGHVVCDVVVALLFNSFPGLESCSFEAVFVAVFPTHHPLEHLVEFDNSWDAEVIYIV